MQCREIEELLQDNTYPGRGILFGRSADNLSTVAAYFIMGRSANSRNRIFTPTADGIQTEAFDASAVEDPSLIIYHPVRYIDGTLIVTNGDQTDTIRDFLKAGKNMHDALQTRTFEPDAPNDTPRISGVIDPNGNYALSILKSLDNAGTHCCRQFFEYETAKAGEGHLIHTYEKDGSPLPAFSGEPRRVALHAKDAQTLAEQLWNSLDKDNRISLFVRFTDLKTGANDDVIVNKHSEEVL